MDDPLQSLRQLAQDIKSQPDITLSHKHIEAYFEQLVIVAHTPDGYDSLCWDIGVWLLLLSGERQSILFNAYGYPAIRAALTSAIESGSLPRGLGWYTSGFIPGDVDGDVMMAVLTHPTVQPAVKRSLVSHAFSLDLEALNPADPALGAASVHCLAQLPRAGLERSVQLMWAARLAEHLAAENPAREQAIRLVLEGLLQAGRSVNAFYWLQTYFGQASDPQTHDRTFEVMSDVVKIAVDCGESGYAILNRLSYDNDVLGLLYANKRTQLLLAFALLWAAFMHGFPVRQDFIDQSADLLWGEYPNMALFVKRLSGWVCQISRQAGRAADGRAEKLAGALDYLQAPQQRGGALAALREDLQRPPAYRGRSQAVDVWRECRDNVFIPLLDRLENAASHKELRGAKKELDELEPEMLLKNSSVLRASGKLHRLEPGLHKALVTHFQKYLDDLVHSAELCSQAFEVSVLVRQLESEIKWSDVQQEYDELLEGWPSLAACTQAYLGPVLEAWLTGLENAEDAA